MDHMKKYAAALAILLALCTAASAVEIQTYGKSRGSSVPASRITDRYGNTAGFVERGGRITDRYGKTAGFIEPSGRATDRYGKTTGFVKKP